MQRPTSLTFGERPFHPLGLVPRADVQGGKAPTNASPVDR